MYEVILKPIRKSDLKRIGSPIQDVLIIQPQIPIHQKNKIPIKEIVIKLYL